MIKATTLNKSVNWVIYLAPVVGDSVIHNEKEWTSVTGVNTEPGIGDDWIPLSRDSGTILDIDAPGSKKDRWVIGTGKVTINSSGNFIGFSIVDDPQTDDDFGSFLITN